MERLTECQIEIKKLRESTGMNRKEFCECFNIPYRTVTEWERGTRNAPDYVLRLLAYYIRIKENNIVVTIPFDRLEDTTYTSEIQDDAQVKAENAQVNVKHVQVETQNSDVNLEEKVIQFCSEAKSIIEICDYLGFKDRRTVRKILNPLLELGRLAMTVPDKPNSRNQKYISIK